MAYDPLAMRYATTLFEAAKTAGCVDEVGEPLTVLGGLLREYPEFQELLFNPDVDPDQKVGVMERVLQGRWPDLLRAFLQMVVAMGRGPWLPQIVDAFQAAVDIEHGRLHVTVRSARPLPEAIRDRLCARLAAREGKQIVLHTEVAPELLGGVQIRFAHHLLDGSVSRQLLELKARLKAVRVL
jgi:F-type H+-transporting ATPase subunit delta